MKWVINLLVFVGLVALLGGAIGISRYRLSGGVAATYYFTNGARASLFLLALSCFGGAYGCFRRKLYGWYVVMILLSALFGWQVVSDVIAMFSYRVPTSYFFYSLIWTVIVGWSAFIFWPSQRKLFKTPNQSSEPTLSSGTSPAEQEPRLP